MNRAVSQLLRDRSKQLFVKIASLAIQVLVKVLALAVVASS